jgi:hypothetical protein
LTIFPESFRIFQKIIKQISKNSKSECAVLSLKKQGMLMQLFSYPAATQTDFFLHFFKKISELFRRTLFQVDFRIFLRKFQKNSILEKFLVEHRKRHLLPKFKPFSIFTKISKLI